MESTWILVADRRRARIFITFKGDQALYELEVLEHPGVRLKVQQGSSLGGPLAWQSTQRQEAIGFARHLANHLEYARSQGKFHRLVIIAAPEFLEMMRSCLTTLTAKLVVEEIDKNLTRKSPLQIHRQLPSHVTMPLI